MQSAVGVHPQGVRTVVIAGCLELTGREYNPAAPIKFPTRRGRMPLDVALVRKDGNAGRKMSRLFRWCHGRPRRDRAYADTSTTTSGTLSKTTKTHCPHGSDQPAAGGRQHRRRWWRLRRRCEGVTAGTSLEVAASSTCSPLAGRPRGLPPGGLVASAALTGITLHADQEF